MDGCSVYAPARESCLVQELGVKRRDEWDEEEGGQSVVGEFEGYSFLQCIP